MATRECQGKILLAAFDGRTPNPQYRRKDLANVSNRSRAIAYFVLNFVAMATEGRGKISLGFDGPTPKPPI